MEDSVDATALGLDEEGESITDANLALFADGSSGSATKGTASRDDWPGTSLFVDEQGNDERQPRDRDTTFPDLDFTDGMVPVPGGPDRPRGDAEVDEGNLATILPRHFEVRAVEDRSGHQWGFIRIISFNARD